MNDRPISKLSYLAVLLTGLTVPGAASAAPPMCKPMLSIGNVQFSAWRLPSMERKWTATVSVDASRCAPNSSGTFEIGFSRAKESGYDVEFRERFVWTPPKVTVGVDVWADEAIATYWIDRVTACPCRD